MAYIFRQYMHVLLINCKGTFAILWEFNLLFTLFVLVNNNIRVDRVNGRDYLVNILLGQ